MLASGCYERQRINPKIAVFIIPDVKIFSAFYLENKIYGDDKNVCRKQNDS
jgi:hypothetical protein